MVVGPRLGEDAAVIDMGDRYLVATSDPITFATEDLGWYALQVNANDIAVRGARPRWFLVTVLLPEGRYRRGRGDALFEQLGAACEELDVALVGGHTEVTHGLDRPIVVGTMLGEVAQDKLVTTGGARVGDAVVLTKGVPLEGAAIIAREKGGGAARARDAARGHRPRQGLSASARTQRASRGRDRLRAGHRARDARPHGGRRGHGASRAGRRRRGGTPHRPEPHHRGARGCRAVSGVRARSARDHRLRRAAYDMAPAEAGMVIHALAREGIDSHFIGQVVPRDQGLILVDGSRQEPLPVFEQDEITKIFGDPLRMPQIGYSHRPVALGREGMVASAHPLATLAGVEVLKSGATVADAAVAVNAVLAVTQPYCCGVGGDFFASTTRRRRGTVHFLNGAGRSGSRATLEELHRRGLAAADGGPGHGERARLRAGVGHAARALRHAPLSELLAPAIHYAERGFPCTLLVSQAPARWRRASTTPSGIASSPRRARAGAGRAARAGRSRPHPARPGRRGSRPLLPRPHRARPSPAARGRRLRHRRRSRRHTGEWGAPSRPRRIAGSRSTRRRRPPRAWPLCWV